MKRGYLKICERCGKVMIDPVRAAVKIIMYLIDVNVKIDEIKMLLRSGRIDEARGKLEKLKQGD
jgi:soluble cytochrome b562